MTRYLNLSSDKALVNKSANCYSECWTGLHVMDMAAFESQYIDKDTYSASAEDIEVQSCFLDDQLTSLIHYTTIIFTNMLEIRWNLRERK
ncbi:hypothetical protein Tco_0264208 [Tanacetum coccineum]